MPTHEPEHYPRMAIFLPHPDKADVCAIDARTGTLPGVRIDTEIETREQTALRFASMVSIDAHQSVDQCVHVMPDISLYRMKRPDMVFLNRPYEWQSYGMDTVRSLYEAVRQKNIEFWPNRRETVERTAMQALGIFVIGKALHSPDSEEAVRSFFFEEPGMYGMDKLSDVSLIHQI